MRRTLNVLVAHDEQVTTELISAHLPLDSSDVEFHELVGSLFPATEELKGSDADILVIACPEGSDDALNLITWWRDARPGRPVILLAQGSRNGYVEKAFGVGVDDLLVMEDGPVVSEHAKRSIEFALRKAMARSAIVADPNSDLGKLICVLGPKGGIGKTITSCNLAVALAERRKRTVLIDLDLQFGDVALSLGLVPENTSFDLAVSGGGLDFEKLDAYLLTHSSGLRVLAAPARPDQAASVSTAFISDVYKLLLSEYDYVVVDTPPAFSPEVITTVDASTWICMIGMLDALSLKNTRLGMETLELMGYDPNRVRVLLNRANTAVGITRSDVVAILGRNPDILVPSHRDVARSVNEGVPVVVSQKRSEAARAFEDLANLFMPTPAAAPAVAVPSAPAPARRGLILRRVKV